VYVNAPAFSGKHTNVASASPYAIASSASRGRTGEDLFSVDRLRRIVLIPLEKCPTRLVVENCGGVARPEVLRRA
jgi:hypothetical protein